jgi:hypothetical protein
VIRSDRYVDWLHSGNLHGRWGCIVLTLFAGLAAALGFAGLPRPLILVPAAALVGFGVGKVVGMFVLGSSGRAAQAIHMPSAAGSYTRSHSEIDTLEARGEYAAAADAWDAVSVAEPGNAWSLVRAGELHLRALGDPAEALHRFLRAREVPGVAAELERYSSQKVIDLYLGALRDEGRAMVELRRLIDRHRGTREAEGARMALRELKASRGGPDT